MTLRMFAFAALAAASTLFTLDAAAQEADLFVSKNAPASAAAGSDVPFDITVANIGPDDAATVLLTDVLPAGMTFVSFTQNNGPAFACTTPMPGDSSGQVSCSAALFAAGASANFTFVANIPLMTGPGVTFTNTATVTSQTFDPNDENNSSTVSTTTPPPPQADLGVTKNGPSTALPDTDVTYTITLTNAGPSTATTVALNDKLPGTMTFVSLQQTSGPALSCSTPGIGAGGTINCTAATLAAGTTATFQLTGHIPPNTGSGTTFPNTATVTSDQDPNDENNAATTLLTVASSDLGITKSAPAMATSGTDMAFVITMTNNGPDVADTAQFTDPLDSGLTFVSIVQNSGPGATCATPAVNTNGTVSCSVGTLNNGASAQFTLTVHIATNPVPPSISNTVTLAASPSDPNPATTSPRPARPSSTSPTSPSSRAARPR
jgi:uncharacterized repeat protein (TIGR01451 family)